MKVCHLTTVHPSLDIRIFQKECKTLAKAGYEVVLIAQHDKNETIEGVQIIAVPMARNRLHRMYGLTYKAFKLALKQKADIYHFHDPELLPLGVILRWLGKKVIYDVHEDVPQDMLTKEWIPTFFRRPASIFLRALENWASKHINIIVAATPFIRDRFRQLGCRAVDVNNYPILSELHLPNVDWSQKERAVCYVGSISEIRGIFEMVEAIGQTDVKLLLAGQFSPLSLRDKAAALPGWANVKELGQLNRTEVVKMLSKSMAGLVLFHPVPSHLDAQPNKMFEYMSAGIPIIVSNFPLWKEIVEENGCGIYVDPLNPAKIAGAIKRVVKNPKESKQMGKNGRRAVKEKYNWENEGARLLKLYEEISKSS